MASISIFIKKDIALVKKKCKQSNQDASDFELLNELNLKKAKIVYSTIPDFDTNLVLINKVREVNKKVIIIVISHQIDEAIKLYEQGASYVVMPHFSGSHHASTLIEQHGFNIDAFLKQKLSHVEYLKERRSLGHKHPPMPKLR